MCYMYFNIKLIINQVILKYYNPGRLRSQAVLTVIANVGEGSIAHAEHDQCQNLLLLCLGSHLSKTLAQSDGFQLASCLHSASNS